MAIELMVALLSCLVTPVTRLDNPASIVDRARPNIDRVLKSASFRQGQVTVLLEFTDLSGERCLSCTVAGNIDAPLGIVEAGILDFEHYPEWFDFLRKVAPEGNPAILHAHGSVLGKKLDSWIDVLAQPGNLFFHVRDGALKGCAGVVQAKAVDEATTIVVAFGQMVRPAYPVPDFLIRWGASRFFARGATRFSRLIEQRWRQAQK